MAQRGRPRTDSIPRFNVDTYLTSNKKFLRLKRLLGVDDERAWLTLGRFFNYVSANCAISGELCQEECADIADFVWWPKDSPISAEELVNSIKKAGFINDDWTVHDQETHQPLAADIKRKRQENQKDQDNSGELRREEIAGSGPNAPEVRNLKSETSESERESKRKGKGKSAQAREPLPVQSTVPEKEQDQTQILQDITEFICELTDIIPLTEQNVKDIRFDILLRGQGTEGLSAICVNLRAAKTENRLGENGLLNPVGWIREQIIPKDQRTARASPTT